MVVQMSKPIRCSTCGDLVGTHGGLSLGTRKYSGACPGYGKHPEPVRHEEEKLGGAYVTVTITYPQTGTRSVFDEYRGESSIMLWALTLMLGRIYNCKESRWEFR
jgi:hypothetical protein